MAKIAVTVHRRGRRERGEIKGKEKFCIYFPFYIDYNKLRYYILTVRELLSYRGVKTTIYKHKCRRYDIAQSQFA